MGGKDQVPMSDLTTMMRALDIQIDRPDVHRSVMESIDPEKTGYITFARLTAVMEE